MLNFIDDSSLAATLPVPKYTLDTIEGLSLYTRDKISVMSFYRCSRAGVEKRDDRGIQFWVSYIPGLGYQLWFSIPGCIDGCSSPVTDYTIRYMRNGPYATTTRGQWTLIFKTASGTVYRVILGPNDDFDYQAFANPEPPL